MARQPGPTRLQSPLEEAVELHKRGKLNPARKIYREVIAKQPANADAQELLGLAAAELGDYPEAIRALGRAAALNPASFNALFNLGMAQRRSNLVADAEASFRRALAIQPKQPDVHFQLGTVLAQQGRLAEAAASYRATIEINPRHADAYYNLGQTEAALGNLHAAVMSFGHTAALEPKSATGLIEQGRHLFTLFHTKAAIQVLEQAIALDPKSQIAHSLLGTVYRSERRYPEAIATLTKAVALNKNFADALFELITAKRFYADWKDIGRLEQTARRLQQQPEDWATSMHALFLIDDSAAHRRASRAYVNSRWPGAQAPRTSASIAPAPLPRARTDRPLRVGYFSTDLGNHPVSYAIAGFITAHDRKKVEPHAFALSQGDGTGFRPAIIQAFDRWHKVDDKPAADIVALARSLQLDIAVDLNGHTAGGRTAIYAQRAAPIQINYLGFPATMGAAEMDYLIADNCVVPPGNETLFDERIVRLPGTYLPNDLAREDVGRNPSRAANGLPELGFVFAAFNTINKITLEMFACWMRLLKAIDGSVLWLPSAAAPIQANLRREAEAAGVAGGRLVFGPYVEHRRDHIARHALADLFLDCTPYNAHTTAADALWAGLPVLTCTGNAFPSRVAASVLSVAGIPELIASDLSGYEAKALALARDPEALAAIRARVAAARTGPLFDATRFARRMEWAFARMAERSAAGEPPAAFDVPEGV